MNTATNNIDPRAKRWGNIAKYIFLFFALAIFAPFIWLAVGGLIGLVLLVAIWVAAWMVRPWVFTKAANLRIMLLKHEAAKNPIPTLQENLRKENVALDERKSKIEKLNSAIRNFDSQIQEIANKYGKQHPAYIQMSKDLIDLRRIYADRCNKWNKAMKELKRFADEIECAQTVWDASQAAAAAREASGLTEDDWMTELKTKTALDSVQNSYNEALASLDTAMLEDAPTRTGHADTVPADAVPATA